MSINKYGEFGVSTQRWHSAALALEYALVPWDSRIFGFTVAQISAISVEDVAAAGADFDVFNAWRDAHQVALVSCRLAHDRLRESMLLEAQGFRFVEMVYPMRCSWVEAAAFSPSDLTIGRATLADLEAIQEIGAAAFATGRFNMDPRIGPELGGKRYAVWVANSLHSQSQVVVKALLGDQLVGFFIYENRPDDSAYWHLTAVSPAHQGQGIGAILWREMIMLHKRDARRRIDTVVSARNTPVLNLYAKLGFRFESPQMTFHWSRQ